ncbi:hypothetical protein VKT23_011493 [Stygiomarasmius scandens]|uniref:Uncharacterized protein n=1 Tax=Marasmiellus scandens TaxID=2682957 RepID=A0ABR1J8E4_9AGAR
MLVLASPTTWVNSDNPYIPIANPSTRPWVIKAGDVVGHIIDPSQLDNPSDPDKQAKIVTAMEAISIQIKGTLRAQDLANAGNSDVHTNPFHPEPETDTQEEQWGLKTSSTSDDL